MERLTFEGNFCDIAQCRDSACRQDGTCTQKEVWKRLKAYEDTGLSPEKVSWMKEVVEAAFDNDTSRIERAHNLHVADKEGRCVVLPCTGYSSVDIARDGVSYRPDHWNIYLTAYAHGQNTPSGLKVGLFDIGEVERALQEMEGRKDG